MPAPLILFGGTFDPVHRAHISCARAASKLFGHATVQLLPNARPPHRDQPTTGNPHRLAMLEIACAPWPVLQVNDWELRQPGPSYSVQTLMHWRAEIGDQPLVLLIGADSLATLDRWHQWQTLPRLCHLLVAPRPGHSQFPDAVLKAFPLADRDTLASTPAGGRLMLDGPHLDVSASAIREALARKGTCPALSSDVLDYIHRHHLYNVPQTTPDDEDS